MKLRVVPALIAVAAIAIFPVAYWIQPYLSDRVTVCFFRTITGHRCPFCGLTHALSAAMHGDFRDAQGDHPLWLVSVVVLIWLALAGASDAMFNSNRLGAFKVLKSRATWPWIGVILAIFWIVNARWGRP